MEAWYFSPFPEEYGALGTLEGNVSGLSRPNLSPFILLLDRAGLAALYLRVVFEVHALPQVACRTPMQRTRAARTGDLPVRWCRVGALFTAFLFYSHIPAHAHCSKQVWRGVHVRSGRQRPETLLSKPLPFSQGELLQRLPRSSHPLGPSSSNLLVSLLCRSFSITRRCILMWARFCFMS